MCSEVHKPAAGVKVFTLTVCVCTK